MRFSSKMRFGLLAAGVLVVGWEGWRQVRQGGELAEVEAQVRAGEQEAESWRSALAAAEQRNREVVEAEGRAGNQALLALMRERAAVAKSASEAAAKAHTLGNALASVLDSPDQQQAEGNYMRDEMRANLDVFFKPRRNKAASSKASSRRRCSRGCRWTTRTCSDRWRNGPKSSATASKTWCGARRSS